MKLEVRSTEIVSVVRNAVAAARAVTGVVPHVKVPQM